MTMEDRVACLLRAAARAEVEGHVRVARALRRMAGEARPLPMVRFEPARPT